MLRYRVGCGDGGELAEYYKRSEFVPELQSAIAGYYVRSKGEEGVVEARVRPSTHAVVQRGLGVDPSVPLTDREFANLMNGLRADGQEIEGKAPSTNTFIDFVFTAPKSFSVALAFAQPAERALLERAYTNAVNRLMDLISSEIGSASVGRTAGNRASNREHAHIAMVPIEHHTARPTYQLARGTDTQDIEVMVPGTMNRHTHIITFMPAFTESGRVTALYQEGIKEKTHEWGALGQAFLGVELRNIGVEFELDSTPGLAFNERLGRLTAIPRWICDEFSDRHKDGDKAAREYAAAHGFDLDSMTPDQKADLLTGGIKKSRREKIAGLKEHASWVERAEKVGYRHRSVIRPGQEHGLRPAAERYREAFDLTLPMIDDHFERRAVIEGSLFRVAAAKALIHTGVANAYDVNVITAGHRSEGVLQDGVTTSVKYAFDPAFRYARVTTQLSVDLENECISILSAAADDKSTSISKEAIDRAVAKAEAEALEKGKKLDFSSGHGAKQRRIIDKIAEGGRAVVCVGVAGSGKSTLLRPLIIAWQEAGYETWGATLAWRQKEGLVDAGVNKRAKGAKQWDPVQEHFADAGVDPDKTFALEAFLRKAEKGQIPLNEKSKVIIDELGLVGTKHLHRLTKLIEKHKFDIVMIGDDLQCQSINAGATIDLARRAFGAENVPELLDTIRQERERDQITAGLFRSGNAAEALQRKDEDGTLFIVPGGYREAVMHTVDLWWERREANKEDERYTLGITVPTNADGRAIGEEIRRRRQIIGEIGPDICEIDATDQNGAQYKMRIAPGDRVRLFDKVRSKGFSVIGYNGTVVEVVTADQDGMKVRTPAGKMGMIGWEALRQNGSNIRLTYGDAVTIDARQSETLTENITAMPGGSSGVTAFSMYTADSRQRRKSWIITSQGAEKRELEERRPLGHPDNRETDPARIKASIIQNMARNLSRQPKKTLAVDFLDRAINLRSGTIDARTAAWFRQETGQEPPEEAAQPFRRRQQPEHQRRLSAPQKRLTGPRKRRSEHPDRQIREERRSMRPAAQRPKRQSDKPIDVDEAKAQFRATLAREGFKFDSGEYPQMDGKWHYHRVEGDRGREQSGGYRGYLDNWPAGSYQNYKLGKEQVDTWRADRAAVPMSADEVRREQERRRQQENTKRQAEENALLKVRAIWRKSHSVSRHAYLTKKGVQAHNIRQDRNGNLIVPYFDSKRELRNVQIIKPDGSKIFPKDAHKNGMFGVIGKVDPDGVLLISEGYATAATLHELTGFPVVYAADAGNMVPAGRSVREVFPGVTFGWAVDNDFHLPQRNPPRPNVGLSAGERGMKELGGFLLVPRFPEAESAILQPGEKPPTDFNDHKDVYGPDETRDFLRIELAKNGIRMPEAPKVGERAPLTQAERDAARSAAQPSTPLNDAQAAAVRQQAMQRAAEQRQHNRGPEL